MSSKTIVLVGAKSEVDGPTLTWAHNLFTIWVLDLLLWVVPYPSKLSCPLSPYYYCASLERSLFFYPQFHCEPFQPPFPLQFLIFIA